MRSYANADAGQAQGNSDEGLSLKRPEFRLEKVGGRWVGDIISESFKRRPDRRRQQLIWDALDEALGAESVRLVGMLLAYTPAEWNPDLAAESMPPAKVNGRRRASV